MERNKKWCIYVLSITAFVIMAMMIIIIIVDPFVHFHKPLLNLTPVFDRTTQSYINPGVAKNFDYDSVLVGSSVSENFHVSQINEIYDVHSIKLPYAGGSAMNYLTVLKTAFESQSIKYVFYSVDMFGLIQNIDSPGNSPVPEYLYNEILCDDIYYIMNKDVLFYSISMLIANFNNTVASYDLAYNWEHSEDVKFSAERVLAQYKRPPISTRKLPEDFYKPQIDASITKIAELIKEHPETEFILFYPPYSVIQHDYYIRNGEFDAFCEGIRYSINKLLEYELTNVKIFSFINCTDIISDLNNYREMMHFSEKINSFMVKEMEEGNFRITRENLDEEILSFKNFICSFDYSIFFDG